MLSRRCVVGGLIAVPAILPSLASSGEGPKMAVIQWQNLTGSIVHDPQTLLIYWGPFQAGDEGQPLSVYAYPTFAWHFTGYPTGGILTNPNVPIEADRTMTVYGTNDNACWGPIFEFKDIDHTGMDNRIGDPMRSGYADGAYLSIKPKAGGTLNPAGPDCGLLLFCSRLFGPRT
jgi:hypothetical protein